LARPPTGGQAGLTIVDQATSSHPASAHSPRRATATACPAAAARGGDLNTSRHALSRSPQPDRDPRHTGNPGGPGDGLCWRAFASGGSIHAPSLRRPKIPACPLVGLGQTARPSCRPRSSGGGERSSGLGTSAQPVLRPTKDCRSASRPDKVRKPHFSGAESVLTGYFSLAVAGSLAASRPSISSTSR